MEPERDEVYERIPWETLQQKGGERNWIVYVVAGAITLGALGYSFTRSQPNPPAPIGESAVTESVATTVAAITTPEATAPPVSPSPTAVASPVVVAEADLYAVDQSLLMQKAAAHAEWFAVEFMSVDGGEASRETLAGLLPQGAPLPEPESGTQVFVDWAGVQDVVAAGAARFEVDVLVRSLVSREAGTFTRLPPTLLSVSIEFSAEATPFVADVPSLTQPTTSAPAPLDLSEVPADIAAGLAQDDELIGGRQLPDGTWELVVVRTGADGVRRPVSIRA